MARVAFGKLAGSTFSLAWRKDVGNTMPIRGGVHFGEKIGHALADYTSKAISKSCIHANVDYGVVHGMAHCQPMASKPEVLNILK